SPLADGWPAKQPCSLSFSQPQDGDGMNTIEVGHAREKLAVIHNATGRGSKSWALQVAQRHLLRPIRGDDPFMAIQRAMVAFQLRTFVHLTP
ncbi:hypothetical protein, partial [Sphingomonas sp. BAUL-RG-20F-R05-02]|uniref:hypothetical protein n=1 Tax=Sphingomonas sp. BAUL-RG-20F-R05-02 TaxID=2914830 RepID=UPI001F596EEA